MLSSNTDQYPDPSFCRDYNLHDLLRKPKYIMQYRTHLEYILMLSKEEKSAQLSLDGYKPLYFVYKGREITDFIHNPNHYRTLFPSRYKTNVFYQLLQSLKDKSVVFCFHLVTMEVVFFEPTPDTDWFSQISSTFTSPYFMYCYYVSEDYLNSLNLQLRLLGNPKQFYHTYCLIPYNFPIHEHNYTRLKSLRWEMRRSAFLVATRVRHGRNFHIFKYIALFL